jgi:hypothetical protein
MTEPLSQQSTPEEEIDKGVEFKMPFVTRLWISIPIGLLIVAILILYCYLIFCPNGTDVSKFGIPEVLLLSITILTLVNVPWHNLGFRIKKIGIIELGEVVKGQAMSISEELADLQKQIDDLKINPNNSISRNDENSKLDTLIMQFLSKNKTIAYSASRILNLSSQPENFIEIEKYSIKDVRESLRRLLSSEKVTTKLSKRGNTLYKIR